MEAEARSQKCRAHAPRRTRGTVLVAARRTSSRPSRSCGTRRTPAARAPRLSLTATRLPLSTFAARERARERDRERRGHGVVTSAVRRHEHGSPHAKLWARNAGGFPRRAGGGALANGRTDLGAVFASVNANLSKGAVAAEFERGRGAGARIARGPTLSQSDHSRDSIERACAIGHTNVSRTTWRAPRYLLAVKRAPRRPGERPMRDDDVRRMRRG